MQLCIILLFCIVSYGQGTKHAKLSKHEKDSLKNELETMLSNDQKYRWMMMYGELDEQKIAEFQKMDESTKFRRFKDVQMNKVGISKSQKDSLWGLQEQIDSVNFFKLADIIKKYGYPTVIDAYKTSTILLHISHRWVTDDLIKMLKDEVKKGNLPSMEYANIYDRMQKVRHLPELYFEGEEYDAALGKMFPRKPLNIDETNKAREEIGLKKYKL